MLLPSSYPGQPAGAFVASPALQPHSRRPRVRLCPHAPTWTPSTYSLPRAARLRLSPLRPCMVSTHVEEAPGAPSGGDPAPLPPARNRTLVTAALAALAAGAAFLRRGNIGAVLGRLTAFAAELGPSRGAALLAGINFCTVLFCFPANMGLMIGAGAVLGAVPAFLALFVSKTAAALVAFLLARNVLYGRVSRWLGRYPKMARVLRDSGKDGGWRFVVLMRLSPFPGFLLNYLLSLTGVTFTEYAIGTFVGIAPSIMNLVLMGSTAKDVGVGVAGAGPRNGWFGLAFKAMCMLSMAVVSVLITKRARQAFAALDTEGNSVSGQEKTIG